MSSREKRIIRREQIKHYYYELGFTQQETAIKLNIDRRTIIRDLKIIVKENSKAYDPKHVKSFLDELLMDDMEDLRRATRQYGAADIGNKASFLNTKVRIKKEMVDKMIKMGIIKLNPIEVVNANVGIDMKRLREIYAERYGPSG